MFSKSSRSATARFSRKSEVSLRAKLNSKMVTMRPLDVVEREALASPMITGLGGEARYVKGLAL